MFYKIVTYVSDIVNFVFTFPGYSSPPNSQQDQTCSQKQLQQKRTYEQYERSV
jgi:hypothetical protein